MRSYSMLDYCRFCWTRTVSLSPRSVPRFLAWTMASDRGVPGAGVFGDLPPSYTRSQPAANSDLLRRPSYCHAAFALKQISKVIKCSEPSVRIWKHHSFTRLMWINVHYATSDLLEWIVKEKCMWESSLPGCYSLCVSFDSRETLWNIVTNKFTV